MSQAAVNDGMVGDKHQRREMLLRVVLGLDVAEITAFDLDGALYHVAALIIVLFMKWKVGLRLAKLGRHSAVLPMLLK